MVSVPEYLIPTLKGLCAALVPDSALVGDGREEYLHVTALYGFPENTAPEVVFGKITPGRIEVKLKGLKLFKADKNHPEHDVLVISVESKQLSAINKALVKEFKVESNYDYNPHITLAYVKPGSVELPKPMPELAASFEGVQLTYSAGGTRVPYMIGRESFKSFLGRADK